jgi:hypothetical protein
MQQASTPMQTKLLAAGPQHKLAADEGTQYHATGLEINSKPNNTS